MNARVPTRFYRVTTQDEVWRPSLRSSLMLLPDLLIAHHITGQAGYLEFYRHVVTRFKDNRDRNNPDLSRGSVRALPPRVLDGALLWVYPKRRVKLSHIEL